MSITAKWDITYKCNLKCEHCINAHLLDQIDEELTTEGVKQVVDNLSDTNHIEYIHFLGGEPTARKDLSEIGAYLGTKNIGFGFNTNGLKMTVAAMKDILQNPAFKNVVISLEGPTAEINDKIRGKNVFTKAVSNIREVIAFKKENNLNHFEISINTVVSSQNYHQIPQMMDFCVELGVDEINLLTLISGGNAKDKELEITMDQELALIKEVALKHQALKDVLRINPRFTRPLAKDYCQKYYGLEFPIGTHGCGAGTCHMFINNKGEMYPCDKYVPLIKDKEKINLTQRKFYDIWDEEIFNQPFELTMGAELYKKYVPCNQCSYLRKECFPCPVGGAEKQSVSLGKCETLFRLIQEKGGQHNE